MKRFLLFLIGLMTIYFSGYAENPIVINTAKTKAINSKNGYLTTATEFTIDGYTYIFNQFNPSNGQMKVNAISNDGFTFYNTTPIKGLKSIVITGSTNSAATMGTLYMKVGNNSAITANATTSDIKGDQPSGTKIITFTVPQGTEASYFHINLTEKGSGAAYFSTIEINYEDGSQDKLPANINMSAVPEEMNINQSLNLSDYVKADCNLKYEVSPEECATINKSTLTTIRKGKITLKAFSDDDDYYGEESCNITIIDPNDKSESYTIKLTDLYTANTVVNGYSFYNEGKNSTNYNVKVTFDKGSATTNTQYYTNGNSVRSYGGSNFTVAATEDYMIKSITLSFATGEDKNEITTDVENFESPTWTGEASSVKFSIASGSGHRRIAGIDVVVEPAGPSAPKMPVVKLGEEELSSNESKPLLMPVSINVSCKADKIFYSLGEEDIELADPYTITINNTAELKVWGVNYDNDGKELKGDVFIYKFVKGEYDENLPAVGSNFKQVLSKDELKEDYYVIARMEGNSGNAMSVNEGNGNIPATSNVSAVNVNASPYPFAVLNVTGEDVLIVKIVEENGKKGIKTVNYGDRFDVSQGYLYAPDPTKTTLEFSKEFKELAITFPTIGTGTTPTGNVNINFVDGSERNILLANNGSFSYQTSGNAIQLYKYTELKPFAAEYADVNLLVGDENVKIALTAEEHPQITYSVKDNADCITIENDDEIHAVSAGTATVVATWETDDTWFGGKAEFNVTVKNPAGIIFRHKEVKGKLGVGVVSQAAYYAGDGKITYTSSNPAVAEVDENTGMIRTSDIKALGETTITATVPETATYAGGSDSYTVIIEAADEAIPETSDATFTFNVDDNLYGFYNFGYKETGSGTYQNLYEHNVNTNSADKDHIPVSEISEDVVNLSFSGNYRYMNSSKEKSLRINTSASMKFSVPENYAIQSIEFKGDNEVTSGHLSGAESLGTWTKTTSDTWTISKWSANDEIREVTFTNPTKSDGGATMKLYEILVKIDNLSGGSSTKILPELQFEAGEDEKKRIINAFVEDIVDLPVLTHNEDLKFDLIKFDIDEIPQYAEEADDDDDDDNLEAKPVVKNYAIESDYANKLKVQVNIPGVYTFRAFVENSDEDNTYGGMAILRLNVFPRLSVLPSDDSKLADDKRNEAPNLTLVHPDEESDNATIKLPTLDEWINNDNDALKYSTVKVTKVTIKEGDDLTEHTDVIPESHEFEKDGSITYTLVYANTPDFFIDETVHVVLMPQTPTVDGTPEDGKVTLTPSQGAKLRLYYEYGNGNGSKNAKRRVAIDENSWEEPIENTLNIETLKEQGVTKVYYQSVKDLGEILPEGKVPEENILASDAQGEIPYVLVAQTNVTLTLGTVDNQPFNTISSKYAFSDLIKFSEALEFNKDFTVSIVPVDGDNWTSTNANAETINSAYKAEFEKVSEANKEADNGDQYNSLYVQYLAITGKGGIVDGFYTAITNVDATADTEGTSFSVSADFPCSGVYELTVSPVEGSSFTFDEPDNPVKITIYPNLKGTFGEEKGFNIDGYTFGTDTSNDGGYTTISFPKDYNFTSSLPCYLPGTYFASDFTVVVKDDVPDKEDKPIESNDMASVKRKAGETNSVYWTTVDLTSLNNASSETIEVTATKNGASGTYYFTVDQNGNVNPSTGVEAIGEGAEVEYYDLNGFKVNADRLDKGIYIRVENGKATKILR